MDARQKDDEYREHVECWHSSGEFTLAVVLQF
jgi:hypothetical protein